MIFTKPLKDILIAVPTNSSVVAPLVPKLIKWSSMGAEVNIMVSSPLVDYVRNALVRHFLTTNKEYLLFIDSDTIPEVDVPEILLKHKKPIVGGLYNLLMTDKNGQMVSRPSGFSLIIEGRPLHEGVSVRPKTGLQRVSITGTGIILIHRDVFSKIEQPWFEYSWKDKEHIVFDGEDVYFCKKCEKVGIPIYCDTDAIGLHQKSILI